MSAIKPPGGPGPLGGLEPTDGTSQGGVFADRVAGATTAAIPANADPTQAILAGLRAGTITGDQAVDQLTALAVARTGAPAALRASVATTLRERLARDPTVAGLLQRMGATAK